MEPPHVPIYHLLRRRETQKLFPVRRPSGLLFEQTHVRCQLPWSSTPFVKKPASVTTRFNRS